MPVADVNVVTKRMPEPLRDTWDMFTTNSAKLMGREGYGLAVGNDADFIVVESDNPVNAIREVAPTLMGFKRGRQTFTRTSVVLHRPE